MEAFKHLSGSEFGRVAVEKPKPRTTFDDDYFFSVSSFSAIRCSIYEMATLKTQVRYCGKWRLCNTDL